MKKAVNNVYSTPVIPKIKFMKNHTVVGHVGFQDEEGKEFKKRLNINHP